MNTYLIAGVLAFVMLSVNTPSLTNWVGSLFKKSQPTTNGKQCVRTQYPVEITDVNEKRHMFTICPQAAEQLLDDLQVQLDRSPTIKANQVSK